jgi:hypothetical protein
VPEPPANIIPFMLFSFKLKLRAALDAFGL